MSKKYIQKCTATGLLSALLAATSLAAIADGTENLGTPSIAIASGTGIVAAGTGMIVQPGLIDIEIPAGATINQVLLYWEGQMATDLPGDSEITVDGNAVTGTLIGGPAFFFSGAYSSAFRADITGLGLIGPGLNTVSVEDMAFTKANNGAGLLVIFDDGSTPAEIDLRDGVDLAFVNFPEPRRSTVPQAFVFPAASIDRTANLAMFFSSVSGTTSGFGFRPSAIRVDVGGVVQVFDNLLDSMDGEEWDTALLDVVIPAGTTMLTVQALSVDNQGLGGLPASFAWTAAALAVPNEPPPLGGEGCTPGYWKQSHHFDSWAATGYLPDDDFEAVFGVDASFTKTLLGALQQGGGGEKALGRHAVAALLNAAHPDVSYAFTPAQVLALVQGAYVSGAFAAAKVLLEAENERGCPLN